MIRHERAGKPFRPSNGTHGESFRASFCGRCDLQVDNDETGIGPCGIYYAAMLYDITAEAYPKEWAYGDDGNPTCTAFCPSASKPPAWLTEDYENA